jgi:maleamate amidohydrolase
MTMDFHESYSGVFDGTIGFGQHPALVIVDFVRAYTTPASPLYAPAVLEAIRATVPLLEAARRRQIPVVHTRVAYSASSMEGGMFVRKIPILRMLRDGEEAAAITPELRPHSDEVVITKHYASAFFGTPLASLLTTAQVDTLLLAGCSTSGCVRATAVDGIQHGFRVIVPRECVADRAPQPHHANLFDIHSKYGDVVSRADVLSYLDRTRA